MIKTMNMELKRFYETPEAELLVIRHEESFLQTTWNSDGNEKPIYDGDEEDFN